jgi:cytochrome c oxidase subunit IV
MVQFVAALNEHQQRHNKIALLLYSSWLVLASCSMQIETFYVEFV